MTDHRDRLGGAAWASAAQLTQQVVFLLLLTRLLRPEDYGLYAMVAVFLGFAGLLGDQTFGPALAQRPTVSSAHLDSVFWYSLLFGGTLTLAFYSLAPALAAFYGAPHLVPLARALSALFLVNSMSVVPRALLQRRVRVDRLARIDLLAALTSGALAVIMAAHGWGAWSLVAQSATLGLLTASTLWWSSGWIPGRQVRWASFRELIPFGGNLLGSNVVDYWARNSDNLLIGRLVGSIGLGLYSRAYTLIFMPVTQVNMLVAKVLFPTLCAVQAETERARQVYLRAVSFLALVTAPMMVGLFVTADALVATAFGREWVGIIPVLRILAPAGAIQTLYLSTTAIYSSHGRTDLLLRWGIRNSAVLIVGIAIGAAFGTVTAVAWGFLAANVAIVHSAIRAPGKVLGLTPADVARAAAAPVVCALIMGVAAWAAGRALPTSSSPWVVLLVQIVTGALLYLAMLLRAGVRILDEFLGVLFGEHRAGVLVAFLRRGVTSASRRGASD